MSKSTPLHNLPNMQNQNNAYEEKENQLVNEILQEIEGNTNQQMAQNNIQNVPVLPQQLQPNNMPPQEMYNEPQYNTTFLEQPEDANTSFFQNLISNSKLPVLAGVLVVLFSIPQVSSILTRLIPRRGVLLNYNNMFVLLLKFVLSMSLFYLGQTYV